MSDPASSRAPVSSEVGKTQPMVPQESIVWMFGTRRTGSTWLAFILGRLPGGHKWGEPLIGKLFGEFYESHRDREGENFLLSPHYRELWLGWIRRMACEGAGARFPDLLSGDGYVVVRDPLGTVGAPLICEALPASRLIVLVRDPRDVVASITDAQQTGGWMDKRSHDLAQQRPVKFARMRAERIVREFGKAREAYESHPGPKVLARYEDLRSDTVDEVTRICSELGIHADTAAIEGSVQAFDWDSVPEEEKGSGKFHRKATPGSWREDLSDKQARVVERVAGEVLDEYYAGWRDAAPAEPTRE